VVKDKLAVRASVNYVNDSGWVDHYNKDGTLDRKGVNSSNSLTVHVSANWTPDATLTVTPAFFYQRANDADNGAFYPTLGLWKQDKLVSEPSHDRVLLGSLTVKKTFGFADLTSVTGVFDRVADRQEDGTYFNSTAFALFFLDPVYPQYQAQNDSVIANLPSYVHYRTRYQQFTQELRLSSSDTSPGQALAQMGGGRLSFGPARSQRRLPDHRRHQFDVPVDLWNLARTVAGRDDVRQSDVWAAGRRRCDHPVPGRRR
jgi:hypothetical protein